MPTDTAGGKPLIFIDSPQALAPCLPALRSEAAIAFDLEFDSHSYAYGFTLCLIQIATPHACYIIDPLAGLDLSGVYAVFEDPAILKIVHSPGEDIRLLHTLRCYPKNLFDTEVPARLLNYEQTSLAGMLHEKLGYSLSKQQQRSNWLKRPLTADQLQYAANDVLHLHALKAALVAEASQHSLMDFVLEEQAILGLIHAQPEERTTFLKPADLYKLSPYRQHLLNGMYAFRDSVAQEVNKPAFHILDDETIRALADGSMHPDDLLYAKGLNARFKNERFADKVMARLEALEAEARKNNLSSTMPPREPLSKADREARRLAEADRTVKFAPVQQEISNRYGINAARFILSNGLVGDIVSGRQPIAGIRQDYRRRMIREIAKQLDIDLGLY